MLRAAALKKEHDATQKSKDEKLIVEYVQARLVDQGTIRWPWPAQLTNRFRSDGGRLR